MLHLSLCKEKSYSTYIVLLSDAASGIISRINLVRVFIEASRNFKSIFLNNKMQKKIYKPSALVQKVLI
jgi:hypothetical protein